MFVLETETCTLVDSLIQAHSIPTEQAPADQLGWVTTALAVGLLLMPAITSLFLRPQREDVDASRVRVLRRQLWIATTVLLAAFFFFQAAASGPRSSWPGWLRWWDDLPWMFNIGKLPHQLMWMGTFPLMFICVFRLMRELGMMDSPHPRTATQRTAQLVNRTAKNPIPPRAWWVSGAVLILGVALLIGALVFPPTGGKTSQVWLFLALMVFVVAPVSLMGPMFVRMSLTEAEPLDASGHPDLRRAYEGLRRRRAWGLFSLSLALTTLFSGIFAVAAWFPDSGGALGVVGGIGGTVVGLAGGIFGMTAGTARMRVNRMLQELQADAESAQAPTPSRTQG